MHTAPQPQIDAAGIKRRQGAELLRHHQRRMVGQHDPARAHPDGFGAGGDMGHQHGSRGARHAGGVVMFDQPVAFVALRIGGLRQFHRLAEGLGHAAALLDGRKVKDG